MSISVSNPIRFKASNGFVNIVNITVSADDKYPNPGGGVVGGYSLTPAQLGLVQVHDVICESDSGYGFFYDIENEKLKGFQYPTSEGPKTELANNATVMRSKKIRLAVIGR